MWEATMTVSQGTHPSRQEVADYYDVFTPLMQLVWDDNLHFGYWLGETDDSSVQQATDRLTDFLIDKIAIAPGQRALDIGCGVGKPALRLAHATGAEVVGISLNQAEVDQANDRARTHRLDGRVRFRYADALALPFTSESFDVVWALESIVHMDRPAALAEMVRVLKPAGRLVLTDMFNRAPVPPEFQPMIQAALAAQRLTPLPLFDEYPRLLGQAGLDVVEFLDITAHTRYTLPRMAQRIRREEERIRALFGSRVDGIISSLTFPPGSTPDFGYLLVVADRPS